MTDGAIPTVIVLGGAWRVLYNITLISAPASFASGFGERLRELPSPPVDRPDFRVQAAGTRCSREHEHIPSLLLCSERPAEPQRPHHQEHYAGICQQLWPDSQTSKKAQSNATIIDIVSETEHL